MTFEVAADLYDRFVGRYGAPLSAAFVAAVGTRAGERALDVGCGPGALLRTLADLLGEENVAGVDPSESFVEAARVRVPGARIGVGVAEDLPFEDAEFDAVLSQLVVSFLRDPDAGVREMCRVARPGGCVAACVWDYAGEMTLLRTFWEAAAALEPDLVADRDERTRTRFAQPDALGALWRRNRLEEVETGELVVGAAYERFDDLWEPISAGVGPAGAYAASLPAERREALRAELHRRLGSPDGPFELSARAWYVRGQT